MNSLSCSQRKMHAKVIHNHRIGLANVIGQVVSQILKNPITLRYQQSIGWDDEGVKGLFVSVLSAIEKDGDKIIGDPS